ncbi:WAT1-related protein At3g18200 isoform X1 [Selaginella moellendorffii]|uniref:WAT1-related protein At3g18200 isoform X1 n=1 Tax=Selaginella moellendorffii TaxID=88036 RepID=UPI000D1C7F7E|nr:WAT1-related protein At3g18200 isoform X1 [Selaginella moellendorffii]|eukprot:XP_024533292.1 WAT1-related protein At3g18200 isoform X1 [Selaginella moellendorffii]
MLSQQGRLHGYLMLAQLAFAGFEILSRIALATGTHPLAFTFYRNCVASLVLGVVAAWTESEHKRPQLGTLLYLFGLGFLGVTVNQVCYLAGLKYTSAIFASAMRNSTPVFTFVIAALWRLEKVDLKRRDGQLKIFGSLLGLCGSLILSIYRGPVVIKSNISISSTAGTTRSHIKADARKTLHLLWFSVSMLSWQIGAFFLTLACIAFGGFLILQAPVLDRYPSPVSFAAFTCLSSVIQTPLLGAFSKWNNWKITSTSEALAILYAGVIGSALVSSIQSWGVLTQGPVIVAAYQPLETIFTALFSMVFLKEDLQLGSIIGGSVVIVGLYALIWGQSQEQLLDEAAAHQLPETVLGLNIIPQSLLQYPLRRFSCDLETRRDEHRADDAQAVHRRHSLAALTNDNAGAQGPLRRMSSTFRSLLREFERGPNPNDLENQQLLRETTDSASVVDTQTQRVTL